MRLINSLIISIIVTTITSCISPQGAVHVCDIEGRVWDSPVYIYYKNSDTIQKHDLRFILRYNNSMQLNNVRISMEVLSPSDRVFCDTIVVRLRNNDGNFIGNLVNNTYEVEQEALKNIKYSELGTYRFKFKALKNELKHVSGIGINILDIETNNNIQDTPTQNK